jgi:TrmH family RNA methyltransferase
MMMLSQRQNKLIRSLHSRKGRDKNGQCIIEGTRSIQSALDAGATFELILYSPDAAAHDCLNTARDRGIHVSEVTHDEMATYSDVLTPPGVMGVASSPASEAKELLQLNSVIVLDGVQDPGNAGTLIRSAAWFGIEGILAAAGTVDLFSPKVTRSTMGGLWDIRLARTKSISEWLGEWKATGGGVAAADMHGTDLFEWKPSAKTALIIGSEANGLSSATAGEVDERVFIPRTSPSGSVASKETAKSGVESLNASVAGGILMSYWCLRT